MESLAKSLTEVEIEADREIGKRALELVHSVPETPEEKALRLARADVEAEADRRLKARPHLTLVNDPEDAS